jgi:cardiolipin synthase
MAEERQDRAGAADWAGAGPAFALFHHNREIWPAVLDACAGARETIDLENYIIGLEGIGQELLDLLAERARQGVRVRVLADGYGSFGLGRSAAARRLRERGGALRFFNPPGRRLANPLRRLHRKTVVCDGRLMMVGGACYRERMAHWRDTMIRLEGPVPEAVPAAFERAWQTRPEGEAARGGAQSGAGWHFAATGPAPAGVPELSDSLLARITGAAREVTLTTPYLMPDRAFRNALAEAAARGVRVRLILPERSDHRVMDLIGRGHARWLERRGVLVHLYQPAMLHAKIALVDDWAAVSSHNLDLFSARLNLESGVASADPALRGSLAEQIARDLAASRPFS